jgi:hypothetical protein
LVAWCAHHLLDAAIEAPEHPEAITHRVNGCRGWSHGCLQALQLLVDVSFVRARARRQACGSQMGSHCSRVKLWCCLWRTG